MLALFDSLRPWLAGIAHLGSILAVAYLLYLFALAGWIMLQKREGQRHDRGLRLQVRRCGHRRHFGAGDLAATRIFQHRHAHAAADMAQAVHGHVHLAAV
ncbi:hypothetical protein EN855_035150, partial [Mesorhizobium sp. M1C.F.Ca.ET.212.01.1.1]